MKNRIKILSRREAGGKTASRVGLLAVVVCSLLVIPAAAGGYYWYDSGVKKPLYMDNELVAEFGAGSLGESAVERAEPGASRIRAGGGASVFRVGSAGAVMQKSASLKPGAAVSPVFREGGNPGGRMMSLPGNVIVFFKTDWTEQDVKGWAAAKKLEIVSKLDVGGNAYVLKTGPGLESLNTANMIQESGEVEAATPNWWKPVQRK